MKRFLIPLVSGALVAAVFLGGGARMPSPIPAGLDHLSFDGPLPVFCFAPGTDEEYMAQFQRSIWGDRALDYRLYNRWGWTAHGATGDAGDPVTLTYSFVPDGTPVDGEASVLFQIMDAQFGGSTQLWQDQYRAAFQRWGELSGITYIEEPDDGATVTNGNRGVIGVRGDCRIAAIYMDGPSNVLAYNYLPDQGDMVMDASENWGAPGSSYRFLRNIVAHEHGHGHGMAHVCPANGTKLLEPYYSSQFDGPQHDDILAVQHNYGDAYELNDMFSTAADLGLMDETYVLENVSLDDDDDIDYWRFSLPDGMGITLRMNPVGRQYLEGPQNDDGSCTSGTLISTIDNQDLNLILYDGSGTTMLAFSYDHPAGESEEIFGYVPNAGVTDFIAEITHESGEDVQLYELELIPFFLADPSIPDCPLDFGVTALNQTVTIDADLVNNAAYDVQVSSVQTSGQFDVTPSGSFTLPQGGSVTLSVSFLAQSLGLQEGTLTVNHNGPGLSYECSLQGSVSDVRLIVQTGTSVNFGDVPVETSTNRGCVLRAEGNLPLTIYDISTNPPFSTDFGGQIVMQPSTTTAMRFTFAPVDTGMFEDYVIIEHSAPSSPDTITVVGHGIPNLGVVEQPEVPLEFALGQNYPNPFNPVTRIAFTLPRAAQVELAVYDIGGRLVRTLVSGSLGSGRHEAEFDASGLATGVYLYRLSAPGFTDLRKMILLK